MGDVEQSSEMSRSKWHNSSRKLWLNIFLTIITSGFWLPIWGIRTLLRRNPSLSASFRRWYNSTESARSRFWVIIGRIPIWFGIPIIFFGAVFREHEVTSTLKTKTSLIENLGSVILVVGLILLALHAYSLVATWQRKRGLAPLLKTNAISVVASLVAITVIFGILDFPASALRWKIDPSAKAQYLASVDQAAKDVIVARDKKQALAEQAILEKQQVEAKKAVAQQKIQNEAAAKAREAKAKESAANAAAAKEAAKQATAALSKDTVGGGFTQIEIQMLKSFSSVLASYVYIYSGFVVGTQTAAAMEYACSRFQDAYGLIRQVSSDSVYFDDLMDRVKDYSYEAQSACAHGFEKNRLDEIGDSARSVATARGFMERILSEIK